MLGINRYTTQGTERVSPYLPGIYILRNILKECFLESDGSEWREKQVNQELKPGAEVEAVVVQNI